MRRLLRKPPLQAAVWPEMFNKVLLPPPLRLAGGAGALAGLAGAGVGGCAAVWVPQCLLPNWAAQPAGCRNPATRCAVCGLAGRAARGWHVCSPQLSLGLAAMPVATGSSPHCLAPAHFPSGTAMLLLLLLLLLLQGGRRVWKGRQPALKRLTSCPLISCDAACLSSSRQALLAHRRAPMWPAATAE